MNRTLHYLMIAALACSFASACIFAVDTDMQGEDPDAGSPDAEHLDAADTDDAQDTQIPDADVTEDADTEQPTPDADADADADVPVDYWVTITGPGDALTIFTEDTGEFVEFDLECGPDDCDDMLECRFGDDDDPGEFAACTSPFEVHIDDIGEGPNVAEVRLVDGDQSLLDDDTHSILIFYNLQAQIEELDSSEPIEFSHPRVGDYTVSCSHPYCETSCQWSDGDSPQSDCSPDETYFLAVPDDTDEVVDLEFEACSTTDFGGDIEHCVTESYTFQYVDPVWRAVDTDRLQSCALLDDDSLWCWGNGELHPLGFGPGNSEIQPYPRHITFADGSVAHWRKVAAGDVHTCAITTDGDLYCWGNNISRAVDPADSGGLYHEPTLLDDEHTWESVAAGAGFGCALNDNGEIYCWGTDFYGNLGVDSPDLDGLNKVELPDESEPDVDPVAWTALDAGIGHVCALAENDAGGSSYGDTVAYCWGKGEDRQLGDGIANPNRSTPHLTSPAIGESADEVIALTTGDRHSCYIATTDGDDAAFCWGKHNDGRLGLDDPGTEPAYPLLVHDSSGTTAISAGGKHTCSLDGSSLAFCWGSNASGQLGTDDAASYHDEPTVVDFTEFTSNNFHPLDAISAGTNHTCAIDNGGEALYCWGLGEDGALGTGDTDDALAPALIYWPHAR